MMEKQSFGFKKFVSTIVGVTVFCVFMLFFASFRISVAEKPVIYMISGVFIICTLMLIYEAMCYLYSYKSEQKALDRAQEMEIQKLKFDQELKWKEVDKKDLMIDELKKENKALKDRLEQL